MKLTWKEPPAARSSSGRPPLMDYDALAAELEARPEKWVLVLKNKNPGQVQPFHRRGLETTTRVEPGCAKGKVNIYARWTEETQTKAA